MQLDNQYILLSNTPNCKLLCPCGKISRIFILRGMRDRSIRSVRELAREIQLTYWSTAGNLSNRSSGVQIPRDICTRFGRYLYSTKCSWIIMTLTIARFHFLHNLTNQVQFIYSEAHHQCLGVFLVNASLQDFDRGDVTVQLKWIKYNIRFQRI